MSENFVVEHPDGTTATYALPAENDDGGWSTDHTGRLYLMALPGTTETTYQAVYAPGQWRAIRLAESRLDVTDEDGTGDELAAGQRQYLPVREDQDVCGAQDENGVSGYSCSRAVRHLGPHAAHVYRDGVGPRTVKSWLR